MNAETFCEHFATFADAPNGIVQLRGMILQLAMQGKLIPRSLNHDTLLPLTSSQVPNFKSPQVAKEAPFELPVTWQWTRLGQVCELINGDRSKSYPNKAEYVQVGVPWINTGHIELDGTLSVESMLYITRDKFNSLRSGKVRPGDLVYCLRGATLGKTAIITQFAEGAVASSLVIIRLSNAVDSRFAYRFLTSPLGRKQIFQFDNGSAQPNLSANNVKKYWIPLPPLAEQRRIVEKVDQLLGLCDELAARQTAQREKRQRLVGATLDRLVSTRNPAEFPTHALRLRNHFDQLFDTPTTIPKLRQTILQLAFIGKLTDRHVLDGSAAELIDRSKLAHRAQWEVTELAKFVQKGTLPRSDKWKMRYSPPEEPELDDLAEIPDTWRWATVEIACPVFIDSPHRTPAYSERGEYPALRPRDVTNGTLNLEKAERVEEDEYLRQTQRRKPIEGGHRV